MKHVIIGTAGHVDHGKTMLIKALTGIDTDRLIEEKKRGITIELGFAHIEFDDHTQAGIIDVPGHEKFIKNMLAGAGGIDLAMLVVAADEGFMPQTVEHLDILTLLGIRDGVVVITKTDMVDEEWVEIVREDIAAHVKGTFLEGKPVLPVSAYTGQGIPELKKELQQRVSRVAVRNEQIPFRLPVDRVFSKDPTIPPEVKEYAEPVDLDKLLDGVTLTKLQKIFESVMKRQQDKIDPVRSTFGTIKKDPVSLEDKITSVLGYARKHRKFSFRQMLEKQNDKTEVVVTFLALLELMKVGKIHLTQEHLFDDMCIESLEPEGEEEDIAIDVTTAQ